MLMMPLSTSFYGLLTPLGTRVMPPAVRAVHQLVNGTFDEKIPPIGSVKILPPGFLIGMAVHAKATKRKMDLSDFNEPAAKGVG